MTDKEKYGIHICRLICDVTDELRDLWLQQQSQSKIREFMNLTVSQSRVLRAVWRMTVNRQEGVMLRDLAEKLGLSCSAVSVTVENLVQRGYLERVTSQDDRRKVCIRISEKGVAHRDKTEHFFGSNVNDFILGCDEEKVRCFEEILSEFNKFLTDKKGE